MNAGQVAVTEDPCLRKTGRQFPDQFCHAPLLGLGARVVELSLCIQASLIADADRVQIEFRGGEAPLCMLISVDCLFLSIPQSRCRQTVSLEHYNHLSLYVPSQHKYRRFECIYPSLA